MYPTNWACIWRDLTYYVYSGGSGTGDTGYTGSIVDTGTGITFLLYLLLFSHEFSNQGVRGHSWSPKIRKALEKKTKFGCQARRSPPKNTRDEESAHTREM